MQESDNTLIYRGFRLQDDLSALVGLFQAAERVDHTGELVTEATLREQITWTRRDPALNNLVVTLADGISLVAYGTIQKLLGEDNADIYIVVHPSWRRQGIGDQLFARLLELAAERAVRSLRVYVPIQNKEADLFVRKHGFEPISAYTRLNLSPVASVPEPVFPQGFTVRSYDQIERLELYTEASNCCYEGYWGHNQTTQEEVGRFLPDLNHAGIFLLFAPDGSIAGTCRADLSEELTSERGVPTALIDAPGIAADYRDARLALPLLLTTIHWLLPQHPVTLELEAWGEDPETLELYRSLGFTMMREEVSYRRDLV
ncbi:MAG TPA: GNAT family N-acetyltransferase [Dictyobacter sp.]|jgi:ribosomal protein S18 acetylase RimI-like enzyme|nr:GNAT family N-acetyltransferase [Dictyobacter sp.]